MEPIQIIAAVAFSVLGASIFYKLVQHFKKPKNVNNDNQPKMAKSPSMEELNRQDTEDPMTVV